MAPDPVQSPPGNHARGRRGLGEPPRARLSHVHLPIADFDEQRFATDRFARLRDELAARVQALQASGSLRADLDPALVAALVIAASDGLQTQWLLDASVDHEAALALLDRLLAPPAV